MDDITEVYVVEEYDLEEGEITDDGVMDVEETPEPKKKKLPKRYCLHQKKILNERHKKDCKHSYHKVKNKEKSSPILNGVHKKHKSSCPLQYHDSVTHIPVNTVKKPFNNSSSLKSAFKNFTSPPRPVPNFHNPNLNTHQDFDDIDNYPDLLLAYKKSRGHLDHKSKLNDYDNQIRHSSPKNSVKQSPSNTFAKSKGQTKQSLNEKSSPKQIETKQSLSERVSPKKFEIKQSLNEKASPKKIETKQSLSERVSPKKFEIKQSLNERASPKKIETKQSLSERVSPKKFETKQSLNERASPKKIETKQPLTKKASPIKNEVKLSLLEKCSPISEMKQSLLEKTSPINSDSKQPFPEKASPLKGETNLDLNKKASLTKNHNKQPLNENTSVPELKQTQNVSVLRKFEKRKKEEESEDEEELRKIALATCVKRNMEKQKASESINNSSNFPSYSLSNQSSVTMLVNGDNGSSDNYEVVDMDLDDENFTEDLDVEDNLFVIDNNPIMSSELKKEIYYGQSYMCDNAPTEDYISPKKDIYLSPKQTRSNDDFEEALLRAELIASINSSKKAPVSSKPTSSLAAKLPELAKKVDNPSLQGQIFKTPAVCSKGQTFHNVSANVKRTNVVKLNNSKLPNSKKIIIPKPRNINATQERLIITLNNDSTSDESDENDVESNENGQENIVTGIDALISNARHKSDIKANDANLNHVSSLSKAQQEEYKKLRNILAEKEPMTIIPQVIKEKSTATHQNLNFLTNKITVAKEKLEKEMEVLHSTEKDVLNQKKVYIASKLKFQHLQEQLHAAKLTKAANLKTWKLCEAKLVNAKNIVAKQKTLISWLETELNSRRLQIDQNSSSPIL